jgi:hypothetical protein
MERTKFNSGKKTFKEEILGCIRKWQEDYKKSGRWLQDAVEYSQDFVLVDANKKQAKVLFDSLPIQGRYKSEQKQRDFEILLANLFDQKKKPIRISLNQNDYKRTKYNKISYFTVALVYLFKEHNLIAMKKGYHFEHELSRMTRICATENLLELFPCSDHSGVRYKPVEVVELWSKEVVTSPKTHKEKVIKKLIDYTDTAETHRIRKILERANTVNNSADIMHVVNHRSLRLNTGLIAVFQNKFTLGGRLYARGISYFQGLAEEERQEITINGSTVVELDYSALHPMLLYASKGIQYLGDPYSAVDKRPEVRPFLKILLLCMINADFLWAQRAANTWLYGLEKNEIRQLNNIGITKARPFMDKFMAVHRPIAHYLCTGKETGMRLMNKDSKIALDVIDHFTKQGIPILCMHDSFIVQKQYANELKQVMQRVYHKHTSTPKYPDGFRCKVK